MGDEMSQCILPHLASALVRSETKSNRPRPPASRVRLVAKSLRLVEAKQACTTQEVPARPKINGKMSC